MNTQVTIKLVSDIEFASMFSGNVVANEFGKYIEKFELFDNSSWVVKPVDTNYVIKAHLVENGKSVDRFVRIETK